jgi:hypothetical protein
MSPTCKQEDEEMFIALRISWAIEVQEYGPLSSEHRRDKNKRSVICKWNQGLSIISLGEARR